MPPTAFQGTSQKVVVVVRRRRNQITADSSERLDQQTLIQAMRLCVFDHYSNIALKLHFVPSIPLFHVGGIKTSVVINFMISKYYINSETLRLFRYLELNWLLQNRLNR